MRTAPSVREVTCDRGGTFWAFSTLLHKLTRVLFYKTLDVFASILFAYYSRRGTSTQKGENSRRPPTFNSPRHRQAIFRTYRTAPPVVRRNCQGSEIARALEKQNPWSP